MLPEGKCQSFQTVGSRGASELSGFATLGNRVPLVCDVVLLQDRSLITDHERRPLPQTRAESSENTELWEPDAGEMVLVWKPSRPFKRAETNSRCQKHLLIFFL